MKQFSFYLFIHLVRVAIALSVEYGLESKFRVSGSGYDGQCQWAMLGVSGIREGGGY